MFIVIVYIFASYSLQASECGEITQVDSSVSLTVGTHPRVISTNINVILTACKKTNTFFSSFSVELSMIFFCCGLTSSNQSAAHK